MHKIAFYLSDYGFGHLTRNIEILKMLDASNIFETIFVRMGKKQYQMALRFFNACSHICCIADTMIDLNLYLTVDGNALDIERTERNLNSFLNVLEIRINREKAFLERNNVELVVSDVVCWAIESAAQLKIQSILLSHFTWYEVYAEYFSKNLLTPVCEMYRHACYYGVYSLASEAFYKTLFATPDDCERAVGQNKLKHFCLVGREFDLDNVNHIKKLSTDPKVYVSVGRANFWKIHEDVSNLPYLFLTTHGVDLIGENVIKIPADCLCTHDYIKGSDYVISRGGWSSVAECLLSGKKMALIYRKTIEEDRNNVSLLLRNKQCIAFDERFFSIKKLLDKLSVFQPLDLHEYHNDNCAVVEWIKEIIKND